ncbi:MAG: hypothetical protein KKC46_18840 [Proteobacteria bacterium]|nr:hypothetical protein [Pseudomonadota bacterium]
MDGSGYPRKLTGDDVLLEVQILAIADVVKARRFSCNFVGAAYAGHYFLSIRIPQF